MHLASLRFASLRFASFHLLEQHVAIAKAGGLQALLKFGKESPTDPEFQCKAVRLLATVASNVAEMMPRGGGGGGRSRSRSGSGGGGGEVQGDIGPAAERMLMSKTEVQMRRGKGRTLQYLHKALKEAAHSAKPPVHLQPLQPAELKSPEQSQKPKKGSSRRRKKTPLPSL